MTMSILVDFGSLTYQNSFRYMKSRIHKLRFPIQTKVKTASSGMLCAVRQTVTRTPHRHRSENFKSNLCVKKVNFYAILFDTCSLTIIPCGLKHVGILSVILVI